MTLIRRLIGRIVDILFRARQPHDLRAMERLCLEQANLCSLPESRAALEELARNYRAAIPCGLI